MWPAYGCHKLKSGSARNGTKVRLPERRDTDKIPVALVAEAANIAVAAIAKANSPVEIIAIGAIMKAQTVREHIVPN